jgi:predicted ATPase/class 3 adenylate cyclase
MTPTVSGTTMTFLFTDIEGSTRQWEESIEMSGRVDRHFDVLRVTVERAGGEIFATLGDGVAAAFASAEAAVLAAVSAQMQMPGVGLGVRMGIHTGEVQRIGADFRGRPVNRAARIMAVGHGGQILLSDVTASLVRAGPCSVGFIDLGPHRLRDLAEPERLWQVAHPDLPQRFPPTRGLDSYSNNLPLQRSSLVGRDLDLRRAIELVRKHRVVTFTGVGGVGKTRLAIQAAADLLPEFGRVWFVELASVADPDDVAAAIAFTLGAGAVADPLSAVVALLGGEKTLLVVDNCEHLVDSVAEVVDTLTVSCPNVSVIATSREALDIEGAHVAPVRSLDPARAVELFLQRAEAAGADPNGLDCTVAGHICRRLDGIPLAIELAAARAATLGAPTVLGALDDRFSVLSGGRRRALDRHGTMRATIDWSYRLLDSSEQRMFQWLAVFSNGFELDAAHVVGAALGIGEHMTTEHIASLVHKSMLVADTSGLDVRYRMLETMRAYALEQLDDRGDRLEAVNAQADWVATLTDLSSDDPCSAAVFRNSIRLEREADNWRDAMMQALHLRSGDLAARLCGPPTAFFLLGRHDLADFVAPLVELTEGNLRQRRLLLASLAVSAAGATPTEQLLAWGEEAAALDEIDPSGVGGLIRWLTLAWSGDVEAAVEVCLRAASDARLKEDTRDLFVGIALLDRFSITEVTDDRDALVERAIDVISRSDVAMTRVVCRLGVAWALIDTQPDHAIQFVRAAMNEIASVPALTRLTLPGSASRLLARLDPRVAARALLEQIDPSPTPRSFVDLIPLSYATALLQRVGHSSAAPALAMLTVSPMAPYLSMMDFVDLARRASSAGNSVTLADLQTSVRAALVDIASGVELGIDSGAMTLRTDYGPHTETVSLGAPSALNGVERPRVVVAMRSR